MTSSSQMRFWLIGLALFVGLLFVLHEVLLPFVMGMAIAYFLDPVCDKLETWRWPRWLATAVVLLGFFLLVSLVILLLVPVFADQISELLARLPGYADSLRQKAEDLMALAQAKVDPAMIEKLRAAIQKGSQEALSWLTGLLAVMLTRGAALANLLSLLVITPIVAFYLLRDWDIMVARVDHWIPRRHHTVLARLASEVDRTLAGFLRGQGMVCLALGLFYAIGLSLAGLDFGLVIGMLSGILSFIPYAGSIFGLVMSVGLAALQFGEWVPVGIVAAIFFAGQMLEGNVLTPKLVGEKVGLHPVWVILALLAFGSLFGFVGILIAVPAAAVMGVAIRFGLQLYLDSPYYGSLVPNPSEGEDP